MLSDRTFLQATLCAAVVNLLHTAAVLCSKHWKESWVSHHRQIKQGCMGKRKGKWGTPAE